MPRIPTVNPERSLSIGNQPNIPMNFGTAPGRAMQKLGSAISGLSGAFKGMAGQADKEIELQNQLNGIKYQNGLEDAYQKHTSSYNPDTSTPEDWQNKWNETKGRIDQEFRDTWRAPSQNSQRHEYRREMQIERNTGAYGSRVQSKALKYRQGIIAQKTMTGISTLWDNTIAPRDVDEESVPFEAKFFAAQALTDELIRSEALPSSVKDQLIRHSLKKADEVLTQHFKGREEEMLPFAQKMRDQLSQEVPEPQPAERPTETVPYEGKILDRAPSSRGRREIWRKGGVVVNLDTNWAKGDKQTTPMVVIPDGATPEMRQAAQAYAAGIADVYKEKFGQSLSPRVVTRSQNGRGRAATIHTEPFAVTDSKAVAFFSSSEGRSRHAQILRDTLGKIPGVHFSIPHMPRKGDNGAVGSGTNEVKLAQLLIEELRQPGQITSQQVPSPSRPSVGRYLADALTKSMPDLEKRHARIVEDKTKQMLSDQFKSVLETGQSHPLWRPEFIQKSFANNPQELNLINRRMAVAQELYQFVGDADNKTSAELEAGVEGLEQRLTIDEEAKDVVSTKAYQKARADAYKILKERTRDPAKAVSTSNEVREFMATLKEGTVSTPQEAQGLAMARMAAQKRLGMPQVPITKSEADRLLAPISYAPQQQKVEAAKELVRAARNLYGPIGERVIEAAVELSTLDSSDDQDMIRRGQFMVDRESKQPETIKSVDKAIQQEDNVSIGTEPLVVPIYKWLFGESNESGKEQGRLPQQAKPTGNPFDQFD